MVESGSFYLRVHKFLCVSAQEDLNDRHSSQLQTSFSHHPIQEISPEIFFFFLRSQQLPALLRLYSGFLFLAYFSPPSLPPSLSHTHIHFLLKTRPSETLCPHSYNSQENFHMPLFWAVTMCICFDFSPPHWFSCFSLMKTDQLFNSPVSASYNPASTVPLTLQVGVRFFNMLPVQGYY